MTIRVALRDEDGRPLLAWGSDIERSHARANGFQVVVLTAEGIQDPQHRLEGQGLSVVRCGYDDSPLLEQARRQVLRCAPGIARGVAAGKRTLVLCAQGENRSAVMTARVLWLLTGESGEGIVRKMQATAQLTCPGDVNGCTFVNNVFRRWAQTWPATAAPEITNSSIDWGLFGKVAAGVGAVAAAVYAWWKWR